MRRIIIRIMQDDRATVIDFTSSTTTDGASFPADVRTLTVYAPLGQMELERAVQKELQFLTEL